MGLHQQQPQENRNAGGRLAALVNCVSLHFFHPLLLHHTQAMHSRIERFWVTATGTRRSGCRAWDDPVQGRNTAVVTQYRGVRVPRGRRQLHAGVPLSHEGCAVLLTGRQLLPIGRQLLLTGRHLLLIGRHVSSTGGHRSLRADTCRQLVTA